MEVDMIEDNAELEQLYSELDGIDTFAGRVQLLLGHELTPNDKNARDNTDKQIEAFEKLVNHAVSRFSVERTRRMLSRLADPPFPSSPKKIDPRLRASPETPRPAAQQQAQQSQQQHSTSNLDSVQRLRDSFDAQKSQSETALANQAETFLRDLQYMRHLKRYFDERIYSTLYRFYYDPSDLLIDEANDDGGDGSSAFFLTQQQMRDDDEEDEEAETDQKQQSNRDKQAAGSNSHRKGAATAGGSGFRYGLDLEQLTDREQLAYAVEQLYDINARWGSIVNTEGPIDPALFDADSEVEMRGLPPSDPVYILLRATPDLFVKCQKSLQLARLWWQQASRIYGGRDAPAPIANYREKMTALMRHIEQKERDIRRQEHSVNIHQADLQFLEAREKRVADMYGDSESLEKHKNELGERYKAKIEQRKDLMERLENTIKNTQRYRELEEELKAMEPVMIDLYRELKLLEYSLDIKQSQFSLELEVKSSFVIYSETSRVNLEKANQLLTRLRAEKRKLERRYTLMKTNQDRMHEILGRVQGPTEQSQRPGTHQTYTIRRLTQDEEKDLRNSQETSKAYVVATPPQQPQQQQQKQQSKTRSMIRTSIVPTSDPRRLTPSSRVSIRLVAKQHHVHAGAGAGVVFNIRQPAAHAVKRLPIEINRSD
uniref:DUF4201 domain-containing protein n=1 Tax=Macrostomum lignano TaxID=282301 RepID=A0A1I8IUR1_9PLAT